MVNCSWMCTQLEVSAACILHPGGLRSLKKGGLGIAGVSLTELRAELIELGCALVAHDTTPPPIPKENHNTTRH